MCSFILLRQKFFVQEVPRPPPSVCLLMYTFKKMLLDTFFFLVKPLLSDFSIFIGILQFPSFASIINNQLTLLFSFSSAIFFSCIFFTFLQHTTFMQWFSTTFVFVLNLHLNVLNVHEQTFCSSCLVISWLNEVHYLKNSLRSHGCRVSLFGNFLFLFPRALILKGPLGDTNSLGYTLNYYYYYKILLHFFSFQCFLKFMIPQVFFPLLKFFDSQVLQISFQSQELKRFSRMCLGVLISLGINFPRYPMGCYFILCIQLFLFFFVSFLGLEF